MKIEFKDPRHQLEYDGWRSATSDNIASHIWVYQVELFGVRLGMNQELVAQWHERIVRWCKAGESVESALMSLKVVLDECSRPRCDFGTREWMRRQIAANDKAWERDNGKTKDD